MIRLVSAIILLAPAALALQIPFLARPPPLSSAPPSFLSSLPPILTSAIDEFINETLEKWKSSGVSVAVVRQDGEGKWKVETKGYGIENHEGKEMTSDSLHAIASNSKLFTSLATGLLVHNDSLNFEWSTKMKDVIPGWELMDEFASEKADLRDMLAHQSGLPRHDMMPTANMTITSLISRLKHLRPSAEFRQHWQYNNVAYMQVSFLSVSDIESPNLLSLSSAFFRLAAHLPSFLLPNKPSFGSYLQEHIFGPLNMSSTSTSVVFARSTSNLADGFTRTNVTAASPLGELRPLPFFLDDNAGDVNSGAGGVITSARDIAVWIQMLLLEGKHPSDPNFTVIPAEAVRSVSKGVSVSAVKGAWPELAPTVYGAGSMISSYRGHNYIQHGGSVPGFLSQIGRLPDQMAGLAVFVNDDVYGTQIYDTIKFALLDRILGLESIDWSTRYSKLVNDTLSSAPTPTPRPSDPASPSLFFPSIAGTYFDPAYGTFELCLVSDGSSSASPSWEASSTCRETEASADLIIPGAIKKHVPTFLARLDRIFTSHLRLEHFNGSVFNVTGLTSLPSLTNSSDFFAQGDVTFGPALAELVVEAKEGGALSVGLGFSGGVWGAGPGVGGPKGETVRERAEVWFEKVVQ